MEMNAGEKVLHELENELHIDIVPGTEVMTDVGSYHFVKSSSRVLVPQPSDDPHDPLNWSLKWKTMCIIASTMVSFTQGFGPLALAPMFPYYMKDFNASLEAVIDFTGVVILVLGFSNFIWVPISTSCGRRPVLIFSQLICFASSIWRAKATSYASFMGATVLNGIGAGPSETIQPAVIADIFFLHDRGCWNTVYWVAYMGSLMVGPIISGSMSLHVGWRSFWWLNTGLVGLSILMIVFMFPETKYHRAHPNEIIDSVPSQENVNTDRDSGSGLEKKDASAVHVARRAADSKQPQSSNALSHQLTADRDPWLGKGSPSWSQWGIYAPSPNPLRAILLDFWVPWKLFAFPIVEFSSFVVSWSCSCFLTINLTQSQNFAAPPYNFNSENIGFMNFAILIGAFIGLGTAGPLSDWVSARATKKNRGIREPEQRLPSMIPYVIVMIIGNFVVAYGYENKWHWAIIVVVGYACAGIQVAALPAMATTYAVDSYKPVSGSLMVSITVNKNLWGYGFSKFLTPWIVQSGYVPPIMTNMSLTTLWCLFGIVFYFFGKQFRRWSKNSSVHRL